MYGRLSTPRRRDRGARSTRSARRESGNAGPRPPGRPRVARRGSTMIACRWAAIGIALAAILDPAIGVPRTERPPIDVAVFASAARANAAAQTAQALELDLGEAGFRVNSGQLPVVRVVVADRAPDQTSSDVPTWAVDMSCTRDAGYSDQRCFGERREGPRASGPCAGHARRRWCDRRHERSPPGAGRHWCRRRAPPLATTGRVVDRDARVQPTSPRRSRR